LCRTNENKQVNITEVKLVGSWLTTKFQDLLT
jgi:hypothetical protein